MVSRYGVKIRKLEAKALASKRAKHKCPYCCKTGVKRKSNSLWSCSKCGAVFAGGAYSPATMVGEAVAKTLG
ncbi:MAG: 50S ribosomal protein L37ae [Candidatus Micrarchaeota archaeon]